MNPVMEAIGRRRALVLFKGNVTDDERVVAAAVDEMEALRDIAAAYADEVRAAASRLPRGEIRAALHDALAATERDDLDGLTAAMLRVADVLGKGRA